MIFSNLLYHYLLMLPAEEWTPFLLKRIGARKPKVRLQGKVTRKMKMGSATYYKRVKEGRNAHI